MRVLGTICATAVAVILLTTPAVGATLAEKKAEVQRIERELATLDARAGAAAAEANAAIDAAETTRRELARTTRDLRNGERDLATGQQRLAERLVGIYTNPAPRFEALLLSGANPTDVLQARRVLDRAARSDGELVVRIRERQDELTSLRSRLAEESTQAQRRAREAGVRRAAVQDLVARRRDVLAGARSELTTLLEQERARRARLASLKLRANSRVPTSAATAPAIPLPGGSTHVFPVAGPTRFSDDWLYSRPGGRYHEGIDLFAERGTPLVAVGDGTVFRVGWNSLGGWRLWLRDTGGTTYYYAHLESFAAAAREGASVSRGTVLGYMGDSGSARGTGVHLHFEIHPGGGGPVRPWPYVTSWPRVG